MRKRTTTLLRLSAALLTASCALAESAPAELCCYRNFRLGANASVIAGQVGSGPSALKTVHSRPALIQQLTWDPQPLGPSPDIESAREVVFGFYNGQLYRITVAYDRYRTEGLTEDDVIAALSTTYGPAGTPAPATKVAQDRYADEERVLATWGDSEHGFELIRSSYGSGFKFVGVLKKLEQPAKAAIDEAARLDSEQAPAREAERVAVEEKAERARLEKARKANRPAFRP